MLKSLFKLLGLYREEDVMQEAEQGGRSAAFNRLRLVLMHDRTQLEPHVIEEMRDELVQVISKYVDVDQGAIELNLETDPETNQVALMASIPVGGSRDAGNVTSPETKEPVAL